MTEALPLDLTRLESVEPSEIPLWNWFCACIPGREDWTLWAAETVAQLLRQPGETSIRLIRTNLTNPSLPAERIAIEDMVTSIGRDPSNVIVLPEATITRQHAVLRRSGAEGLTLLLEDLGSSIGTLSGGNRLTPGTPVELTSGSEFVIFPHRFQLEMERSWSAGGDVEIYAPRGLTCTESDYFDNCPAHWGCFPVLAAPTGKQAHLAIENGFLNALVQGMLAPLDAPELGLDAGYEAWLELLLLAWLERANRDLAWPLRFALGRRRKTGPDTPVSHPRRRGVALSATIRLGPLHGAVALWLPFELLSAMQGCVEGKRRPAGKGTQTLAGITSWKFPVSRGHVVLTAAEQTSIDPGDVVLFDAADALLFPGDDSRHIPVNRIDGSRIEVKAPASRRDITIMTTTTAPQNGPVPFEDLPIRVEILVAEREMTIAEAELLAPGSIIDLGVEPKDPVRLAVNGRVVGSGELVEIEGRLGVRILEWGRKRA
jgi:type III secretion system YscQ/HrcQ family protein